MPVVRVRGKSGVVDGGDLRVAVEEAGERIVFLPYTREVFTETQQWIESHQLFDGAAAVAGYDEVTMA